jgi:hypothetical protein
VSGGIAKARVREDYTRTTSIWALATLNSTKAFALLFSQHEGQNWQLTPLPPTSDGHALPASDMLGPTMAKGDFHSLLAFGDSVVMTYDATPSSHHFS